MKVREKEEIFGGWYDGGDPVAQPTESSESSEPEGAGVAEQIEEAVVPVSVVQELREEMKSLKSDNETLKQTLTMAQQQQQGQQQPEQQDQYGGLFKDKDDDDIPNVADLKNVTSVLTNTINTLFTQMGTKLQYKDYDEVVSKHLVNALQNDPALINAIKSSSNPHALAYTIAKTDPEYQKSRVAATNEDALKKLHANAGNAVSVNQVAGGVGKPLVDNIMNMSKEDFEKKVANVVSRGG